MNDDTPGSTDRRTSDLLQAATTDLSPDVDRLVRGGVVRGRTLRRRRRVGTSLAAVAVFGVIGAAASLGPGLLGNDNDAVSQIGFADAGDAQPLPSTAPVAPTSSAPASPTADPTEIDSLIVVSAKDIPSKIAELLPAGDLGKIRTDEGFPLTDERQEKTVHFMWDGTLTTFIIERADTLASCEAQVDPADQPDGEPGGTCSVVDGVELLTWGPTTADGVTAQGVSAWMHGYVVSALSYNAADGKDVATVTTDPPISLDDLTTLVTSEVWFGQ